MIEANFAAARKREADASAKHDPEKEMEKKLKEKYGKK